MLMSLAAGVDVGQRSHRRRASLRSQSRHRPHRPPRSRPFGRASARQTAGQTDRQRPVSSNAPEAAGGLSCQPCSSRQAPHGPSVRFRCDRIRSYRPRNSISRLTAHGRAHANSPCAACCREKPPVEAHALQRHRPVHHVPCGTFVRHTACWLIIAEISQKTGFHRPRRTGNPCVVVSFAMRGFEVP